VLSGKHMRSEIEEQPLALERLLGDPGPLVEVVRQVRRREPRLVLTVARGSSDHAATLLRYAVETLTGVPVASAAPSVLTVYGRRLRLDGALVVGISQSGESVDVAEVVAAARGKGTLTVAVTNNPDSTLARGADLTVPQHAGAEQAVAATKTYLTQAAVGVLLAARWAGRDDLLEAAASVPDAIRSVLASLAPVETAAVRLTHASEATTLGRGYAYATAQETGLKLSETCALPTRAYSPADFLHGPIAAAGAQSPVIAYATDDATLKSTLEALKKLRGQGADVVVVSDSQEALALATAPIGVPAGVPPVLEPLVQIVAGQWLALNLALARGLDPDKPRGLQKVTKTR